MDTLRQPLSDAAINSGSRLPRPPVSRLPAASIKRARSPAMTEPTKKKLKFEPSAAPKEPQSRLAPPSAAPKGPPSRLAPPRLAPPRNVPRVTAASRLQASRMQTSRNVTVGNLRRETMPARPHPVLNSTVEKPGQRGAAASVRPNLNISPIEQKSKKKLAAKRRPAWDLTGRIQDMELMLKDKEGLEGKVSLMMTQIDGLRSQKAELAGTVQIKEQFATTVTKEVDDLKLLLRQKEEELLDQTRKVNREIDDLKFSISSLERQKDTLDAELNAKRQEIAGLMLSIAQQSSAQACLRAELDVSKVGHNNANQQLTERDTEIAQLKATIEQHETTIDDCTKSMRDHETARRKLHNTIQELKGNIRVFCRVRPLLNEEIQSQNGAISHINFPDIDAKVLELDQVVTNGPNESLSSSNAGHKNRKKQEFSFDRVFNPDSTQKDVFDEISQLVQSALDGYNVCIFAYGQTGSGKTYTMEGADIQDEDKMGMIPRATMQVFETAEQLMEKGWTYEFTCSFVEIYNETIRDLLGDDDLKHEIKITNDKSNSVYVSNLKLIQVKSRTQIHKLLEKASHRRAVGETKLNLHSSRSHSVFSLVLKGNNQETGETCIGELNLVDLAGSERLKDSGSEGKRLKETQAINKSLSNLAAVFTSLAKKDAHIPYRNSKLTYLLQNSLGGNSKTLMFVNVSPKEEHYNETLNSLRFATGVNNCNIGTAQKKTK